MYQVHVLADAELTQGMLAQFRRLVLEAYEGDFTDDDWDHTRGGWRVVLLDGQSPLSHAAVVPRLLRVANRPFRAGYVEAVATVREKQRTGLGALVMAEVTSLVRTHFDLGALSTGRHQFYQRFGWERWRGPSFVQHGASLVRTPDEDDGLMVLRFGSSARINLAAPIACEPRSGEDW